jgi:uncharacterized protein Usg
MMDRPHRELRRQLDGYCLATAEILYRMPDHPVLLQSYVWQNYDLPPEYPELRRFLDFWRRSLDGPLHSVRVAHSVPVGPRRYRHVARQFNLH